MSEIKVKDGNIEDALRKFKRQCARDELIKNIPGAEKISIDTVDKLLRHKNAAICFMSCTNIYEILEAYQKLLSE